MRTLFLTCFFIMLLPGLEYRGPYISQQGTDHCRVMFHTKTPKPVQLKLIEENKVAKTLESNGLHHQFDLTKLDSRKHYTYAVHCEQYTSDKIPFSLAKDSKTAVRFIAYGDSRDQYTAPKRHSAISRHFNSYKPQFILQDGDLLIGGAKSDPSLFAHDWTNNFFVPLAKVIDRTPFYIARGNHDIDFKNGDASINEVFPKFKESLFYSFDNGPVHVTMMSVCNQIREFQTQEQWLINDLKKAQSASWRVVVLHVSPFSSGKYGQKAWTVSKRTLLTAILIKYKVDLVISGHDHSYQRFHPLKLHATDKHAVQFIVCGLAGTNPYTAHGDAYTVKYLNKTDHFMLVDADQERMQFSVRDNTNTEFDAFALSKKNYQQYVADAKVWSGEIK